MSCVAEHALTIAAPRARVWSALQRFTAAPLRTPEGSPIATLLGTQLRTNFEVLDSAGPHSLTLAGRHRFTRYMLTFELNDAAEAATHLRTQTCAERPHPMRSGLVSGGHHASPHSRTAGGSR